MRYLPEFSNSCDTLMLCCEGDKYGGVYGPGKPLAYFAALPGFTILKSISGGIAELFGIFKTPSPSPPQGLRIEKSAALSSEYISVKACADTVL